MAFDEGLAQRLREYFQEYDGVVEKKMFGGLCFMVCDHMCCGIMGDSLMARVGPDNYTACLEMENASEMDFTGRAMKGMVYVSAQGIESDDELAHWVGICQGFVRSLPPKKPK